MACGDTRRIRPGDGLTGRLQCPRRLPVEQFDSASARRSLGQARGSERLGLEGEADELCDAPASRVRGELWIARVRDDRCAQPGTPQGLRALREELRACG